MVDIVDGQNSFGFLERQLHASLLERESGKRKLILTGELELLVLDLMSAAADVARRAPKRQHSRPPRHAPTPEPEDMTPVVVWIPLNAPGDQRYAVRESVLPAMRKAYPSIDVVKTLHKVELDFRMMPELRPTPKGVKRSLAWQLQHAQERAEGARLRSSAITSGNAASGNQRGYVASTGMDPRLSSEMAERRKEEEVRRAAQARPASAKNGSVIDGLFRQR